MGEVGIQALKQNASQVAARAAAGDVITVTDQGRSIARIVPIRTSKIQELLDAGIGTARTSSLADLSAPRAAPGASRHRRKSCRGSATVSGTEPELMAIYVDTSAAVKLLVREPETSALRRCLRDVERDLVSSDLLRTELARVALQLGGGTQRAQAILAAALDLGDELDAILTYDERRACAAKVHGVEVVAPT